MSAEVVRAWLFVKQAGRVGTLDGDHKPINNTAAATHAGQPLANMLRIYNQS